MKANSYLGFVNRYRAFTQSSTSTKQLCKLRCYTYYIEFVHAFLLFQKQNPLWGQKNYNVGEAHNLGEKGSEIPILLRQV